MGKKETNSSTGSPFTGFSVLKGEFVKETSIDKIEDDITDGTEDILDDSKVLDEDAEKALKDGDEALQKVIKAQEKAAKKASKEVEIEDPEEDEEAAPEGDVLGKEASGFKEFTKALYDKGVLDFNDEDTDFEESEEGIEKLVNKTVQNRIDKWAAALPEDYAKFLEFTQNGGTPKQFLDVYYGNHSWADFKIETEEAQKLALRESLRLSGESPEDIEDMITEWSDNGTLEKRAKPAITKLQKHEATQKAELVEYQKQQAAAAAKAEQEYWNNFKKDLEAREDIAGFKLTPKVKEKLWDFMTKVDRSGKTAYETAVEKNKDSSLLFALQAMQGFDISKLEKQVETRVSNKYSAMLKNYSNNTKNKISSGSTEEHTEENPFKAFKGLK